MTNPAQPVMHRAEFGDLLSFVRDAEEGESRIIAVTPYEAAYVLKHRNPHNRSIRPVEVRGMAWDMRKNNWPMNGETVKFDIASNQLDGQHRFTALASVFDLPDTDSNGKVHPPVPQDFTVRFLVVGGLAPDAQDTVDMGVKRTHGDVFGLHGYKNSMLLASVLRKVWMWERGDVHFSNNLRFSVSEAKAFLDTHQEVLRSVEIADHVRKHFKELPPSVVGCAHYVFNKIDAETTPWFFQRLADGADLHTGHPVLTLRESLRSTPRERAARRYQDQDMAVLIRTWNAVRKGKNLEKMFGLRADGQMPMPE